MEVDVIDGGGGEDRVKVRVVEDRARVGDKDEAAEDLSIGERWIFVTILRKRKDFENSIETLK